MEWRSQSNIFYIFAAFACQGKKKCSNKNHMTGNENEKKCKTTLIVIQAKRLMLLFWVLWFLFDWRKALLQPNASVVSTHTHTHNSRVSQTWDLIPNLPYTSKMNVSSGGNLYKAKVPSRNLVIQSHLWSKVGFGYFTKQKSTK